MPLAANPRYSRFDKMNIPTRAAWIRTLRRELHRSLQYGLLSGTAAIAEMQRKKKKRIIPDTLMYTEGFGGVKAGKGERSTCDYHSTDDTIAFVRAEQTNTSIKYGAVGAA